MADEEMKEQEEKAEQEWDFDNLVMGGDGDEQEDEEHGEIVYLVQGEPPEGAKTITVPWEKRYVWDVYGPRVLEIEQKKYELMIESNAELFRLLWDGFGHLLGRHNRLDTGLVVVSAPDLKQLKQAKKQSTK